MKELEEQLQGYSAEIEQLRLQLAEKERECNTAIIESVREATLALHERNEAYQTIKKEEGLFESWEDDQRLIKLYEENEDILERISGLKEEVDAAKDREEQRTAYSKPLEEELYAGVVALREGGKLELYVTVDTQNKDEGLSGNLAEAVGNTLAAHAQELQESNVAGIHRLIATAYSESLVPALEKLEPAEFADAKVVYKFIIGEKQVFVPEGAEREIAQVIENEAAVGEPVEVEADEIAEEAPTPEEIPVAGEEPAVIDIASLGRSIEEVLGDAYHLRTEATEAITGFTSTALYKSIDRIVDAKVEVEDLLNLMRERDGTLPRMYRFGEAALVWHERAKEKFGSAEEIGIYEERLKEMSELKKGLPTIQGKDGRLYFSEKILGRIMLEDFARRFVAEYDKESMHKSVVAGRLGITESAVGRLVTIKKLRSHGPGRITIGSLRNFLDGHRLAGKKWLPKND